MNQNKTVYPYFFFSVLLFCAFLFFPVFSVYADGKTSIIIDNKEVKVGDTVKVEVRGDDTSSLSVKYSTPALTFEKCDADGYSESANTISFIGTKAVLTFKAHQAGSSNIIVSSDKLSGSSTAFTISGEDEKTDEESEDDEEPDGDEKPEADKPDESEGDFTIDGRPYVLSERFEEKEIPSGFSRVDLKLHGGTYKELQNGDMTLVYLKEADKTNEKGTFYVYDPKTDQVTDLCLVGTMKKYVITKKPDKLFAEKLVQTDLLVKDQNYIAYQFEGISNDFYYLYGMNQKGKTGWYEYDIKSKIFSRANTEVLKQVGLKNASTSAPKTSAPSKEKEKSKFSLKTDVFKNFLSSAGNTRTLMAIGIFIAAVLLIIIINIIAFRRSGKEEEGIDYEINDSDTLDGGDDNQFVADDFEEAKEEPVKEEPAEASAEEQVKEPEEEPAKEPEEETAQEEETVEPVQQETVLLSEETSSDKSYDDDRDIDALRGAVTELLADDDASPEGSFGDSIDATINHAIIHAEPDGNFDLLDLNDL